MNPNDALALPFLGMMLLTLVVWVVLYIRRIGFLRAERVHPQKLTTRERLLEIVPEQVSYPAYNLMNLFEMPVLFYALCLYLMASGQADGIYVGLAWAYLGLRIVHSTIHCTSNVVMHRFYAYALSSLVLGIMIVRAAIEAVG